MMTVGQTSVNRGQSNALQTSTTSMSEIKGNDFCPSVFEESVNVKLFPVKVTLYNINTYISIYIIYDNCA